MKHLTFLFFVLLSSIAMTQEGLYDLRNNQSATESYKKAIKSADRAILEFRPYLYEIDTLSLPFFDDFSTNLIKQYDAQKNDPDVSVKVNYDFSVDGTFPATVAYLKEQTYSYIKTIDGNVIATPNPELIIQFYNDGNPTTRDTGWTNVITELDEGLSLVTYDTIDADVYLTNNTDTLYVVADDKTLWTPPIDSFDSIYNTPYINNVFAKKPLTQGVATFDGTDINGYPYDISTPTSYRICDMLESKPLYIDSLMSNVFVSFIYQAGGHGNMPDDEDSLVVEFYDVPDQSWNYAWSTSGEAKIDSVFSKHIFLPVEGPKYQVPGFRFRFKNYATASGSLDHWHVDYVQVGKSRDTLAEDTVNDVAFTRGIQSFFEGYTSVPYKHYLATPTSFESGLVTTEEFNLGTKSVLLNGLRYEIFDPEGNMIRNEITANPNLPPQTRDVTFFEIKDSPVFPDLGEECVDFTARCWYTATGIGNKKKINDTIRTNIRLWNYYSYDDGSAEKAYALTGAGLELAYKFYTPIKDTLKALMFNFPQTLHDDNPDLPIKLIIWTDINSDPVYESDFTVDPIYTNANEFVRYELDKTVILEDSFYIGFRQIESKKIYIGFDANLDASDNLFYRINETWYPSAIKGSLMLRPDFGDEKVITGIEENPFETSVSSINLYPNPAEDYFMLSGAVQNLHVQLFNLAGSMVGSWPVMNSGDQFSLTSLPNGMYLARIIDANGMLVEDQKLIINR